MLLHILQQCSLDLVCRSTHFRLHPQALAHCLFEEPESCCLIVILDSNDREIHLNAHVQDRLDTIIDPILQNVNAGLAAESNKTFIQSYLSSIFSLHACQASRVLKVGFEAWHLSGVG